MGNHQKSVVITGASTGIGRACALALVGQGWRVFAGIRAARDGDALRRQGIGNLTPVFIDVTHPEAIAAAAQQVQGETGEAGLDGLVNNAGIAVGGPLEFVPISQLRRQLEVNVIGQIAVMQSFLPLLRRAQGRVVLMGSISGLFSLPLFGPYSASKFALEAMADALRLELRPWGIQVAIVEPGATRTAIWDKSVAENRAMRAHFPAQARILYGDMVQRIEEIVCRTSERAIPSRRVAKAVTHALTDRRPKARYVVGEMARIQLMMEALPVRLRDLILAQLLFGQRGTDTNVPISAPELGV